MSIELCGIARELLDEFAAQLGRYLLDRRDIAPLEYLLDCPASTLHKAQKVIHLLGRRDCVAFAGLLALALLVLRCRLLVLLRCLLGLWIALLRIIVLLLNRRLLRVVVLLDWWLLRGQCLRCVLLGGRRQLHRLDWLLRWSVVVQLRLHGVPHEVEHAVYLFLELLRFEAVWQLNFDLAMVLLA